MFPLYTVLPHLVQGTGFLPEYQRKWMGNVQLLTLNLPYVLCTILIFSIRAVLGHFLQVSFCTVRQSTLADRISLSSVLYESVSIDASTRCIYFPLFLLISAIAHTRSHTGRAVLEDRHAPIDRYDYHELTGVIVLLRLMYRSISCGSVSVRGLGP